MRETVVSSLPGPYQVAEVFESRGEGADAKDVSVGFVVLLSGFGRLTAILSSHVMALGVAENFNNDFAEFLTLGRPVNVCPLPGSYLPWTDEQRRDFRDIVEEVTSSMELSRETEGSTESVKISREEDDPLDSLDLSQGTKKSTDLMKLSRKEDESVTSPEPARVEQEPNLPAVTLPASAIVSRRRRGYR